MYILSGIHTTDETNCIIAQTVYVVKNLYYVMISNYYGEWLLKDLKEELKKRGCKVSGKKKDLVERYEKEK